MENSSQTLRILVIGAHPDDCEIKTGGIASFYKQAGHEVHYVSLTNGESGHHRISGDELVQIRRKEASEATKVIGISGEVLSHRDGYLQPTIEARLEIIALIRNYQPDLIITHRLNDYHPDHRATSQVVCDAAYMVTVPPVVPEVPALKKNPVIAYMSDDFKHPYPFSPTVIFDIGPVFDRIIEMLHCHSSQFYEWLPYNGGYEDQVPENDSEKLIWLKEKITDWIEPLSDRFRDKIIEKYGQEKGNSIRYVEAFEICEYGSQPDEKELSRLFPFD